MASTLPFCKPPSFAALRIAWKIVIPAHVIGAAFSNESESGILAVTAARARKYSAKLPSVCRPASLPFGQKLVSAPFARGNLRWVEVPAIPALA